MQTQVNAANRFIYLYRCQSVITVCTDDTVGVLRATCSQSHSKKKAAHLRVLDFNMHSREQWDNGISSEPIGNQCVKQKISTATEEMSRQSYQGTCVT